MIEDFIGLSQVLTGEEELDFVLAEQYFERVRAAQAATPELLPNLLERFRQICATAGDPDGIIQAVREQIVADEDFKKVAQQIITLWYTGAIKNGANYKYASADQYFSGLFWQVIKAHPPMLSGGYFGYWKYPPEN